MWLKAQNKMEGFWPHAAMGPVERMVRHHLPYLKEANSNKSDGQLKLSETDLPVKVAVVSYRV